MGVRPLPLTKLVDDFAAQWEYVANEGTRFTFKTNLSAPRYRSAAAPNLTALFYVIVWGPWEGDVRNTLTVVKLCTLHLQQSTSAKGLRASSKEGFGVCCRLVRTDVSAPGKSHTWPDVIPQHEKDLLQWASALKVSTASLNFPPSLTFKPKPHTSLTRQLLMQSHTP